MGQKLMCCSTSVVQGLKPVMMMLVVQASYVGMNISYKLVTEVGMNFTILVAYRNMFSAALMLPLALIFERKRPKLTLSCFKVLSPDYWGKNAKTYSKS
ncbi:hypothetical protein ACFX1R_009169 [Malus domestica]